MRHRLGRSPRPSARNGDRESKSFGIAALTQRLLSSSKGLTLQNDDPQPGNSSVERACVTDAPRTPSSESGRILEECEYGDDPGGVNGRRWNPPLPPSRRQRILMRSPSPSLPYVGSGSPRLPAPARPGRRQRWALAP